MLVSFSSVTIPISIDVMSFKNSVVISFPKFVLEGVNTFIYPTIELVGFALILCC